MFVFPLQNSFKVPTLGARSLSLSLPTCKAAGKWGVQEIGEHHRMEGLVCVGQSVYSLAPVPRSGRRHQASVLLAPRMCCGPCGCLCSVW